ncbi:DNA polymerase subunit Cdc27 [Sphaerosporella brunnea]|uniref:DNA polymerase delta subunit 3 n=1 Tax=Sphaerosporella brunnea TaxID=1250544 RepID=A0A5J5ESR3_9PEZI|nr:DNA polymerase subunit Cdc27 [Sphaerosporella brunnea]
MDDYADHLLGEVLGEQKLITYRALSRALKVHVHTAKEMLYAFYAAHPGKVLATYMLTGLRAEKTNQASDRDEDDDVVMPGASEPDRLVKTVGVKTVVVVPEEKLSANKATFVRLDSIAVYSVQPAKPSDPELLPEASQELLSEYWSEDPKVMGATYGVISNVESKKRTAGAPAAAPSRSVTATPAGSKKPEKKPVINTLASAFAKKPPAKKKESPTTASPEPTPKSEPKGKKKFLPAEKAKKPTQPSTAKKAQKDFFSNWAAKAKDKKPAQPEPEPVSKMDTDSEDEAPAPVAADISKNLEVAEKARSVRAAKKAELVAMMDLSDSEPEPEKESTPEEVRVKEESPPPSTQPPPRAKRRAKRKVTKKVTTQDEEGYLVTKIESVRESYSEGEEEPPPAKKPTLVAVKKEPAAKKQGRQAGQKGIMSFFQKK